jgi:hypothetical protein
MAGPPGRSRLISALPKVWPRAQRRAARLLVFRPSTGRFLEREGTFLPEASGAVVARAPANTPEGRHGAAYHVFATTILASTDPTLAFHPRRVDRG